MAKWFRHPFFSEAWHDTREYVLERDDGKCKDCGIEYEEMHVHHLIPRKQGGKDEPKNLVTLCSSCHAKRHAKMRKCIVTV
jgi:5-methylcytosine-specific restriction endonuclease McrA